VINLLLTGVIVVYRAWPFLSLTGSCIQYVHFRGDEWPGGWCSDLVYLEVLCFLSPFSTSFPFSPSRSLPLSLALFIPVLPSALFLPVLPSPEGWDWRRSLLWTRDKHASLGRNHRTVPGPGEERKQVRMMLGNVGSPNILCTWVSYWGYSWIFLDTIVLVTW